MNPKRKAKLKQLVLATAARRDFLVHVYSWSAADLRKLTRRMAADGELRCVLRTKTHFHYRTPQ